MKPRTARAIEPNVGSRKALEKKLVKMYDDLFKRVFAAIVDDLTEAGMLSEETLEGGASDAALALTGAEKRVLSNVQKKLKAGIRPNEIGTRVNRFSAERIARWLLGTDEEARKISHWFVNTAARDATAAQRKALLDAGVSPKALKERWSVPYLKKTFLAPETANALPSIADMVTSGLKGFSSDQVGRLQKTIVDGLQSGYSIRDVWKELSKTNRWGAQRAKQEALRITLQVHSEVERKNCESLGVREGIWIHVPGQYMSRSSHMRMNGKRFELGKGLWDEDAKMYCTPGQLYYCRCTFRQVIPPELLQ